ncbi:MAG TPA: nucleoside 2-deoxyribosyltransferase, partial [Acetobacteraceae bacterium]
LSGISPLDALTREPPEWATLPVWRLIALRNEAHIRGSDALIANLTPFRGVSADAGTIYEIGFARGLGLPVFAYANEAQGFAERAGDFAATHGGLVTSAGGVLRDAEAMLIERFGLFDSLMIEGGITDSGGSLFKPDQPADRWRDLATFEQCVSAAARHLGE